MTMIISTWDTLYGLSERSMITYKSVWADSFVFLAFLTGPFIDRKGCYCFLNTYRKSDSSSGNYLLLKCCFFLGENLLQVEFSMAWMPGFEPTAFSTSSEHSSIELFHRLFMDIVYMYFSYNGRNMLKTELLKI